MRGHNRGGGRAFERVDLIPVDVSVHFLPVFPVRLVGRPAAVPDLGSFMGSWHCSGCGDFLAGGPTSTEYRSGHTRAVRESHGLALVLCGPVLWDGPVEEVAVVSALQGEEGSDNGR